MVRDPVPFVDLKAQYRDIEPEVVAALASVMQNASFIMGPDVAAFEQDFACYVGAPHCIGVESGTAALKLAMQACGIGRGDEVIMPANTYIACAVAVSQLGATPAFVDMNDDDYEIDVAQIARAITPRTKAIMPVHAYGQMADVDAVCALARAYNLTVIEDASQAHGAALQGCRAGTFGDVAAFSFYPGKNLGAYGDAGAVVTADDELADRIRLLRNLGQREKHEHLVIGDNCRLDTMQAAVLRVKLPLLDGWNEQRRRAARRYDERLVEAGFTPPLRHTDEGHVYHLYVVRVAERDRVASALLELGIQTGVHYPIPIHLQEAYRGLGIPKGTFPRTERAAETILSLPMFPELTDAQIDRVVTALSTHAQPAESFAAYK